MDPSAPHPQAPIPLQTGALTPEQIALMLTHLPVDMTFVDAGQRSSASTPTAKSGSSSARPT